jgi:hypothetical protein
MKHSETETWRAILIDGIVYEKQPDGTLVPAPQRMDYDKIDRMSDAEIEALAARDEDGLPAPDEDWAEALANRRKRLAARKLG